MSRFTRAVPKFGLAFLMAISILGAIGSIGQPAYGHFIYGSISGYLKHLQGEAKLRRVLLGKETLFWRIWDSQSPLLVWAEGAGLSIAGLYLSFKGLKKIRRIEEAKSKE